MSCLAGLFAAKYGKPKLVVVTDGNKASVDNVQATLKCNEFETTVICKVLKWNICSVTEKFDVILCADCLFFDEARADLIECLWAYLKDDGIAYVMAPQRGDTLDSFLLQSNGKGFICKKITNYSNVVWEKRADYWKSQERKYCDFCKCWIADNKPSVEFHEKGRRHQENVKRRIKTISKNSAKAQRDSDRTDATLKQMEIAALTAYRRDVESNANADLTSIAINKKLKEENLSISGENKKIWHEAQSKEGQIYYWNVLTNETSWEPPKEGFLSLKDQRDEKDKQTAKELKDVDKARRIEGIQRMQVVKQEEEEERARLARDQLKQYRVQEDIPEPVYGPIIDPGKNDPYGKWQTVKQSENIDLQLPVQQEYIECPVVVEPEPFVKEFKEKTVDSLASMGECSSFKKRKISSLAKKNTRQRLDDD
ncbi:hypothetical protein NQ315_005661 [Exocentrus adspersus]|uniref:Calmodulin-lysine N-methyltransferase n=1 Tax=Exocentrus adspersus TaxID=1586481 RepID=A0AAV8V673_9CUCU|nr:hypothetical protein NQ315_005661 [Exocentrus adspersus]